jgi:hypothetical protein
MRIHNLYTDGSGQSHFRDIEVEWVEERRGSKLSKRLPATGIIFRETQAEQATAGCVLPSLRWFERHLSVNSLRRITTALGPNS